MRVFLEWLFLIPCLSAVAFYLYALYSARDLFSEKKVVDLHFTPAVSILKPLRGIDANTYEDIASFCRQEYPVYQLLLGVLDDMDPGAQLADRLIHDFPKIDIQLVVSHSLVGANPKVRSLVAMESCAKHPVLLVSDSDIRVGPDYLKRVVQPLRDPSVGAVTCMGRSRPQGIMSILEALRVSTEFYAGVLVARKLEGVRFGLGSTIVVWKDFFNHSCGGFLPISDYLADDYQMGHVVAKAGRRVVLSDYVVEHSFVRVQWRDILRRQIRWARGIRVSRPWSYAGLILTQGIPVSLFFLWATWGSAAGWAILGITWTVRLAMAAGVGGYYLKDPAPRKFLWLVPVQDLISFGVWCVCFFGDSIYWRGERFRLTKTGKLIPEVDSTSTKGMLPVNTSIAKALVPGFIRWHFSANAITGLSLLSGLLGGWALAKGTPGYAVIGALWFLSSNVLDECDGKVARQTNTCSRLGGLLDTLTDCVVHAAFFIGLGIGMTRQFPHGPGLFLGWVAAAGSLVSCILDVGGITPWQPPAPAQDGSHGYSLAWVTEWLRIDFSLLVVVSALLRHMAWILWSGALGVFLFWIPSTFLIAVRGRR